MILSVQLFGFWLCQKMLIISNWFDVLSNKFYRFGTLLKHLYTLSVTIYISVSTPISKKNTDFGVEIFFKNTNAALKSSLFNHFDNFRAAIVNNISFFCRTAVNIIGDTITISIRTAF